MTHLTYPTKPGSFQLWVDTVKGIVGEPTSGLSLLDLCCCECTVTSRLDCYRHVGVDVVNWPTRSPKVEFELSDALAYTAHWCKDDWDLCICSDGIEHLTKDQGNMLLLHMTRIARLSIIFTPLGDYVVEPDSTHPDKHRSGWTPEELADLGWATISFPAWHSTQSVGAFFAYKGTL